MEESLEKLTEKIITKDDLFTAWDEAKEMERLVFKQDGISSFKSRGEHVSEGLRNYLVKLTKSQRPDFLKDAKKYLGSLPVVKVEVAFTPSRDFVIKMSEWFKKTNGQRTILDIIRNPHVAGGLTLEYQGKYGNFSLAKEIDGLVANKKL